MTETPRGTRLDVKAQEEEYEEKKKRAVQALRRKAREIASAKAVLARLQRQYEELLDKDLDEFLTDPDLRQYGEARRGDCVTLQLEPTSRVHRGGLVYGVIAED